MTTTVFPTRPFRFGVQCSQAATRKDWIDLGRAAEDAGFSTVTMPDHFGDQLAPMPALQAILDATTTLRAGALVFDNDYKHPAILAKELATMDVLSDGRVEIGLGAGWMISDYDELGLPYDPAGVRIDRFVEGLRVIKGAMADETLDFVGKHYTIRGYNGLPKPLQRPHPPVLIGGGGKRVLSIAAREADIVGVNASLHAGVIGPDALATMAADVVDEKVKIVAAAAGDRVSDIEMNIRTFMVSVTDDRAAAISAIAGMAGVDDSMIDESPFALIGSVDKIVEDLLARRERFGFSYVIVGGNDIAPIAPVVAALAGK